MASDEVGLYMRLLCYEWLKGGLPDDDNQLLRLGRWDKDLKFPESVRRKFVKCADGLLRNERLEEERGKQERYSATQRANIERRWNSAPNSKPNGPADPPGRPKLEWEENGSHNTAPLMEDCVKWLADVQKNGANYTEKEMRSAWLALNANGWMWGKNPVADWRSALERQIQTDRSRTRKPMPSKPKGANLG